MEAYGDFFLHIFKDLFVHNFTPQGGFLKTKCLWDPLGVLHKAVLNKSCFQQV